MKSNVNNERVYMKFVKENFYDVLRLIINQVGIAIFSIVIYTAAGSVKLESETATFFIKVLISVFSTVFYYALIYTVSWDWGAKDKIRIDGNRMAPDNYKGLKLALIANIPNFVLSFIYALTFGIYLLGAEWIATVSGIANILTRFWMAIYLGIIQGIFVSLESAEAPAMYLYHFCQAIGFLIIPIIAILITHFGYLMGRSERRIFGFIKTKKQS